MSWKYTISDFTGLAKEVVERLGKHKVAENVDRDRQTIRGWLAGADPSKPSDVSWLIRLALENNIDVSSFQSFNPIYDFSPLLTYEERVEKLPDLSWLTSVRQPPAVNIEFCGMTLNSPIGVSSGPLLGDDKWSALMLDLAYGMSTFKTRRTGPKKSWDAPQIAFLVEHPDLKNYDPSNPPQVLVTFDRREVKCLIPDPVNSIGVPSESPAEWQEVYERIKRHPHGGNVGISVMGDGKTQQELEKDFLLAVEKAKDLKPPFIELNKSCPNLEKGTDVCDDPDLVKQICLGARRVLKGTGIPLIIKLPFLTEEKLRGILKAAGPLVHAVSYRNTIRVRPVTNHREGGFRPAFPAREFGGLSGPCTFEMTRRGLIELVKVKKELGLDFGVIAIGGITTPDHVIDLMNEGANVVQACTGPMFDPLLAWKARFKVSQLIKRAEQHQSDMLVSEQHTRLELMFPRDETERESFNNAEVAIREIKKRFPKRKVPHELFLNEWNAWMQQRPPVLRGEAQRVPVARSLNEWIRIFTGYGKN